MIHYSTGKDLHILIPWKVSHENFLRCCSWQLPLLYILYHWLASFFGTHCACVGISYIPIQHFLCHLCVHLSIYWGLLSPLLLTILQQLFLCVWTIKISCKLILLLTCIWFYLFCRMEIEETLVSGSFSMIFLRHSLSLGYRNHKNVAMR